MGRLSRTWDETRRRCAAALLEGEKSDERFSGRRRGDARVGRGDGGRRWRDRGGGRERPAVVPSAAKSQDPRPWLERGLLRVRSAEPGRSRFAAARVARTQSQTEGDHRENRVVDVALQ